MPSADANISGTNREEGGRVPGPSRGGFREAVRLAGCWLLFALAVLAVYYPSLGGGKLWDDHWLVGKNLFFRSPALAGEAFRHFLFDDSPSRYYRPVQVISYAADYALWGDRPAAYRTTNCLLHATAAFLLWRVLRRVLSRFPGGEMASLAVSLLWAVHPIHSAAVAYISGRADPLAAVFVLAAWWVALAARPGPVSGAVFFLLLFLGLASKEIAAVWIGLMLFLLAADPGVGRRKKGGAALLAVAAIGACFFLRLQAEGRATVPPVPGEEASPLAWRVCLMLRALGDYCGLLVYPARLMMDRTLMPPPSSAGGMPWGDLGGELLSLFGAAVLAGMLWLGLRRDAGRPLRLAGLFWFWFAFLPVSNLIPLNAQSAEHWIYAASIGLLLFLAGICAALPRRLAPMALPALLAACTALGARTWHRAADWSDPERFFRATIAAGGGTVRIHANLAQHLLAGGRAEEAEAMLREGLRRFPGFAYGRAMLASLLSQSGRAEEAAELISEAPASPGGESPGAPGGWEARLERANAQVMAEDPEALATLDALIADYPGIWLPVKTKAWVLERRGDRAGALRLVAGYAEARPWSLDPQVEMARLFLRAGMPERALAVLREADWLDVRDPAPEERMARMLREISPGRDSGGAAR